MLAINQMLKYDEGARVKVYKDSLGFKTIGIGFNMDSSSARNIWTATGIPESFEDCYAGRQSLTADSISKLLYKCIDLAKEDLQSIFNNFNTFPEYTQFALINMMFQLGKSKFSKFFKTINYIKSGNFEAAANNALDSLWGKQTPERAKRVTELLKGNDTLYAKILNG